MSTEIDESTLCSTFDMLIERMNKVEDTVNHLRTFLAHNALKSSGEFHGSILGYNFTIEKNFMHNNCRCAHVHVSGAFVKSAAEAVSDELLEFAETHMGKDAYDLYVSKRGHAGMEVPVDPSELGIETVYKDTDLYLINAYIKQCMPHGGVSFFDVCDKDELWFMWALPEDAFKRRQHGQAVQQICGAIKCINRLLGLGLTTQHVNIIEVPRYMKDLCGYCNVMNGDKERVEHMIDQCVETIIQRKPEVDIISFLGQNARLEQLFTLVLERC
jgi:hypothetical protein